MDPVKNLPINTLQNLSNFDKGRGTEEKGFQDTLKSLISQVDREIKETDRSMEEFAVGKQYNLHGIMIESEKADLSFRFLLQIRNKLLEAYQEIMRMNF